MGYHLFKEGAKTTEGIASQSPAASGRPLVEMERLGPMCGDWPNYYRLGGSKERKQHCHLNKKGRPTYVAVWEETEQGLKLVEIIYVGTRENAPY